MMDQNSDAQEELSTGGKFKNWLQDNIRIILSVLIVLSIAGAIYSYSKRTEPLTNEELAMQEGISEQTEVAQQDNQETEAVTITGGEQEKKEETAETPAAEKPQTEATAQPAAPVQEQPQQQTSSNEDVKVDAGAQVTSQETGEAFVEIAVKGDSKTTLARKALKAYLEKNNDSSLTPEHKIFIEDYLQRRVQADGTLQIGEQLTFSKDLIKEAVDNSKNLNEKQLNNLKKFSSRVQGL
jgi:hypothetical protein